MSIQYRIVCMVPSWTETLIEAGLTIVGRTRFCIHPSEKIKSITVVGGTKDIDWKKVKSLNATHIILDQDENPRLFFDEALSHNLIPIVTNVQSLEAAAEGLYIFAKAFSQNIDTSLLADWAKELKHYSAQKPLTELDWSVSTPSKLIQTWILKPSTATQFLYLIWKNPWMAASRSTFIGDVLFQCGIKLPNYDKPYPEITMPVKDAATTLILLSSEPYPFAKKGFDDPDLLAFPRAIVDGENFSWFGIRSLRFLREIHAGIPKSET